MRFIFVSALSSLTVPTILKPGEGKTVRMPDTHEPTDTNHSASFTDMQSINPIALRRPTVRGKNAKFTIYLLIYLFAKHTYTYKGKKKHITIVARGPERNHEAYELLSLLEVRGQKLLE